MSRITTSIDSNEVPSGARIREMLDAADVRYTTKNLPAGSLIGWDDEPQMFACFLESGIIEIYVSSKDGRRKVVDRIEERGFFSFQIIRKGCHPHATAQATESSTVIIIPRDSFYRALHVNDEFTDLVVWYLYELLHAKTQEVAAQAFYSVHQRVALFLLEITKNEGARKPQNEIDSHTSAETSADAQIGGTDRRIVAHVRNSDIADILGASRNSVTLSLSHMQKLGIIEKTRNSIIVIKPESLKRIVEAS